MVEVLSRLPLGIEPVEAMQNLDNHLTRYGEVVADRLWDLHKNREDYRVGIALIGGAIPLPYILRHFQYRPEVAQAILDRAFFLTTSKDGSTASGQVVLPPIIDFSDNQTLIFPEDILDDAGTALVFGQLFPNQQVEVYPAFHKPHSLAHATESLPKTTHIFPFQVIPDQWVFGAGMDGGSPRLTGLDEFDQIKLALLQRFASDGFAYCSDSNPPHDELISFLEDRQIPAYPELRWLIVSMELAKMHGDMERLSTLSEEYLKHMHSISHEGK